MFWSSPPSAICSLSGIADAVFPPSKKTLAPPPRLRACLSAFQENAGTASASARRRLRASACLSAFQENAGTASAPVFPPSKKTLAPPPRLSFRLPRKRWHRLRASAAPPSKKTLAPPPRLPPRLRLSFRLPRKRWHRLRRVAKGQFGPRGAVYLIGFPPKPARHAHRSGWIGGEIVSTIFGRALK